MKNESQLQLPLASELEQIVAEHLAFHSGRDNVTDNDYKVAAAKVAKWSKQRQELGLPPYR